MIEIYHKIKKTKYLRRTVRIPKTMCLSTTDVSIFLELRVWRKSCWSILMGRGVHGCAKLARGI